MVNQKDKATRTPLYCAVSMGAVKCVQLLMSDGRTDPNIKPDYNIFRDAPLMMAVKCNRAEIVELLLRDKRTEPNIKDGGYDGYDGYGNTPLMHAIKENLVDCVKVLFIVRPASHYHYN